MTTTLKPPCAPSTTKSSDELLTCAECGKRFDPSLTPVCPECYGLRNMLEAL